MVFETNIDFLGDLALQAHKIMVALLHDFLGNLLCHHGCRCIFLLRIGEDPNFVKPLCFDKGAKRLIVRVRLAGKSDNKCRSDGHPGDTLTQLLNQFLHTFARVGTVHRTQHCVMRMLKRKIDIFYNLRLSRKYLDEFIGKVFRIAVENTNPCELLNLRQRA